MTEVWEDLLRALALVMVIEGLAPFMAPRRFRDAVLRLTRLDDRWLRLLGLGAMLTGLLILNAVK